MEAVISKTFNFLLDPVYHWAILIFIVVVASGFRRALALKAGAVLLLYYFTVVFTPFSEWMIRSLERRYDPVISPEKVDAFVVLTGGTLRFHGPSQQFYWFDGADRFLEALRQAATQESNLLITGTKVTETGWEKFESETESMGKYAKLSGWPEEKVFLETTARTTRENALRAAEVMENRGLKSFYLATSAYHMPRSMKSFEGVGLKPIAFPVDFQVSGMEGRLSGFERIKVFRLALHEYIGMIYYKLLDSVISK